MGQTSTTRCCRRPATTSITCGGGFDRLYSTAGSLFLDERCRLGADPTANWLVYGHNMADGSMLGELSKYEDEAFWREQPDLHV